MIEFFFFYVRTFGNFIFFFLSNYDKHIIKENSATAYDEDFIARHIVYKSRVSRRERVSIRS